MKKIWRSNKAVSDVISATFGLTIVIFAVFVASSALMQPLQQSQVVETKDIKAMNSEISSLLLETTGGREDTGTNWEDAVALTTSVGLKANPGEQAEGIPVSASSSTGTGDPVFSNDPPYMPSDPNPTDGAANVDINTDLSWTGGDPDGDTVTYDVYFEAGDSTPDELVSDDQSETTYNLGLLSTSTSYYWQIVATDNHGEETIGHIWDFTTSAPTSNNAPAIPTLTGETSSGSRGVSYDFTAVTTDPDSDNVKYYFSWGDGSAEWSGSVASGAPVTRSHSWDDPGTYGVKVKAEDDEGATSDFSNVVSIVIGNGAPDTPGRPSGPTSICLYDDSEQFASEMACFVAGTEVVMADGSLENIESLQPGDMIRSYDVENSVFTVDTVKYVYHDSPDIMHDDYYLLINGDLGVTSEHPLLIEGEWISAGDLMIGDVFTSGKTVDSIDYITGRVWTYTLETVGDNHNFVVSLGDDDYVVAHNYVYMGISAIYSTTTTDPEGDSLLYRFDWGDGTGVSGWDSSSSRAHTWLSVGTYQVKAQAKDEFGALSAWSDALTVTVEVCSSGGGGGGGTGDTGDTDDTDREGDTCCFPAGTLIAMDDGSFKNIEDIVKGDIVLSYNCDLGVFASDVVTGTTLKVRSGVYDINDGLVSPTDDHPLFVRKSDGRLGWAAVNYQKSRATYVERAAMPLEVGDELLTSDGWVRIYSIEYRGGTLDTYTFGTSSLHTYLANSVVVSNSGEEDGCCGPCGCTLPYCSGTCIVRYSGGNPVYGTSVWEGYPTCSCVCKPPNNCFLADTKIVMADDSLKNIEEIETGDLIKSYDLETDSLTIDEVKSVQHDEPEDMLDDYYLLINDKIEVTSEHPILVEGQYKNAGMLELGDKIGEHTVVESMESIFERAPSYNFETVSSRHNYLVDIGGEDYLIAHNDGTYVQGGYDEETSTTEQTSLEYSSILSINKINALKQIDYDWLRTEIFDLPENVHFNVKIQTLDGIETLLDFGPSGVSSSDASIVTSNQENVIITDLDSFVSGTFQVITYKI